nr:hypothetical protein [Tanacetum cinerariifolium]
DQGSRSSSDARLIGSVNGELGVGVDDDYPMNKRVEPGKKAHGFRVELGGDVGSDSIRLRFMFVLGATTNMVASKGGERRIFSKYDEEEFSDDVNYDDKIVNEETTLGFLKNDDDDVSQKDNSRNDEDVLWNLLKESIMLRRNLREKDVKKDDTSIFDDLILIMLERKEVKILELESTLTSTDNETEFEDHLKKLIQVEVEYIVISTKKLKTLTSEFSREIDIMYK